MLGGDDLADDYIPEPDIIVISGDEAHNSAEEDEYEDFQGFQVEDSKVTPPNHNDQILTKKRKRREKEKEKKAKKRKLIGEQEDAKPISSLSPNDAALYLATHQSKALSKLSALELDDIRIPVSCIADTTSYSRPHSIDEIGTFIGENFPQLMLRLRQKPKNNGAPTLVFIAGAALRVADVTRILRKHRGEKGGEVAKLFARHFKLSEHIAYLKRTKVGVAVGTPARLGQLLEAEALTLTALTHIFIDTTYRDAKKRSMFDIPETREEIFRGVLNRENIRAAFLSGKIQLVLF